MERKQWSQNAQPLFFSTLIAEKDQCANFTPLSHAQAIFEGFSATQIDGLGKGMILHKKNPVRKRAQRQRTGIHLRKINYFLRY
ncbi:hypothetical protein [Mixta hanseatica]|uniref:Uncharacterized protein n=1 Tax=Mixta hanseatica TaxID=2872648 RepID=A0ABY4RDM6_9GAMM|nr:hypothetical protein [Mixta hanseatica]UQY45587.1 hypothetical protein K6958_07995 [Mixta hanseatica]